MRNVKKQTIMQRQHSCNFPTMPTTLYYRQGFQIYLSVWVYTQSRLISVVVCFAACNPHFINTSFFMCF